MKKKTLTNFSKFNGSFTRTGRKPTTIHRNAETDDGYARYPHTTFKLSILKTSVKVNTLQVNQSTYHILKRNENINCLIYIYEQSLKCDKEIL